MSTTTHPRASYRDAAAFVSARAEDAGSAYVVLTEIPVGSDSADKGRPFTETFRRDDQSGIVAWMQRLGRTSNLYWCPATPKEPMNRRLRREDVQATAFLWADIDPRAGEDIEAERERIISLLRSPPEGVPAPTGIVFSGGGYQAFWRLSEPIEVHGIVDQADEAALYSRQLALRLGGDHCHSLDHLMRVPWTINRPDAKKRQRGRIEIMSEVVEWNESRVYSIEQFEKAEPARAVRKRTSAVDAADLPRVESLPDGLSERARLVIQSGRFPDRESSRSEPLLYACCELCRAGLEDEQVLGIITDERFGVSESILDKGRDAMRYAARQVERARKQADEFQTTEKGAIVPNQANIRRAIARLGVLVEYDEFADRLRLSGLDGFGGLLDDRAMNRLRLLIEQRYGFLASKELFYDVVADEAMENRRHPVREYLAGLRWDGVERLGDWLPRYLGADDTPYVRAVGRLVLVAAVRRVRQPGCKFDEMLVLEGRQGGGKSSALRSLAIEDDWFTDDLPLGGDTKRQMEALSGRWIIEAGELKGMRKGDVEALKGFLSASHDRARLAYARIVTEIPRQCVLVGTTNATEYLRDMTGNRRFWPVRTEEIDLDALRRDRDQLWAEASLAEAQGQSIRLDPGLYAAAAAEQADRERPNPLVAPLSEALGELQGRIASEDLWRLLGLPDAGRRTQQHNDDYGDAMRRLGWAKQRRRLRGKVRIAWVRGDGPERALRRLGDEYEVVDAAIADEHVIEEVF